MATTTHSKGEEDKKHDDSILPPKTSVTSTVICKERFPKAYRHPSLDETLTKSRTKAEAKNLTRCRRGGVSVPLILGVDLNAAAVVESGSDSAMNCNSHRNGASSACLFMEYVPGCTVRSFLNVPVSSSPSQIADEACVNQKDNNYHDDIDEPCVKRQKISNLGTNTNTDNHNKRFVTRLDEYAFRVAYQIGVTVAKMHNVNIVHGDLTTSNMMLRNHDSVSVVSNSHTTASTTTTTADWTPDIVLIDFGLSSISVNTKKTSSHEERAVDLYVLERSFVTTHVGSEELVKEIMRGYKATCQSSDSVFVRLAQVRLRGRKRECFG